MLSQVHEHIVGELNQGAKTDTVFVVTAIIFDLIVLGINSAVAGEASSSYNENTFSTDIIMVVFMVLVLLVNGISITGLAVGRSTRNKLLSGLVKMYSDHDVAAYYDTALLGNYNKRYALFTVVIGSLAATAVIVPLIIRFV
ncbi:MAG TPA: hypothetical protein VJ965_05660 [Anaerolineales bacterium]|nr:hypothetical protein [Anaerolineales bacterium]